MMESNITPYQYAYAVGNGMTIQEATAQLEAAEIEAAYTHAVTTGRQTTRELLTIALLAYINHLPLPLMSRKVATKFNKYVKPYGDLLKAQKS